MSDSGASSAPGVGFGWPLAMEPTSYGPALVGATRLHERGITGAGVTLAILDTGLWNHSALSRNSFGQSRVVASYDATNNEEGTNENVTTDGHGHGTHLASIVADSQRGIDGAFRGVAPDIRLVVVKSFDENAQGSYLDVLRGLNWILKNKDRLDIRVLNLSFSAPPRSFYWDDPINQAVMRLWQAGVVVVASSGNTGPDPMTIRVPGNTPYIITVGATSDNDTPSDPKDDRLAEFSSAGPTVEGFIKPDFLAPGSLVGLLPAEDCVVMSSLMMSDASFCQVAPLGPPDRLGVSPPPEQTFGTTSVPAPAFGAAAPPVWRGRRGKPTPTPTPTPAPAPAPAPAPTSPGNYAKRSGTSQATALVSGIVALMIQADPTLTPDEVKYRLMASARPATDQDGRMVYTVFQQGAGAVNASRAAYPKTTGVANGGLDIDADRATVGLSPALPTLPHEQAMGHALDGSLPPAPGVEGADERHEPAAATDETRDTSLKLVRRVSFSNTGIGRPNTGAGDNPASVLSEHP